MGPQLSWTLFLLCAAKVSSARLARKTQRQTALSSNTCAVGGFCGCSSDGNATRLELPLTIWSKGDVQAEVTEWSRSEGTLCQPHSAYAVVYAGMAAERDFQRCIKGTKMYPTSERSEILTDALSDLMTRYFVEISSGSAPGLDIDGVWAELRADGPTKQFNSLEYAMASTGIFLTSHTGLALSALPHAEELWEGSGLTTVEERVEEMRRSYKGDYDAYNRFLGNNVDTIGYALYGANLTSNRNVNIASVLLHGGSVGAFGLGILFGNVRDKTWKLAMDLAEQIPMGHHPMTQTYNGRVVLATSATVPGSLGRGDYPAMKKLADHARFWRKTFGDNLGGVWKTMGGLSYTDLTPGGANYNTCVAAAR